MHIYYKYFFQLKAGRLTRLSAEINGVERDTTLLYYPLRDIENIRKQLESIGHDVTMSICFDSKSKRNDDNAEYKAQRTSSLVDDDYANVDNIRELLNEAGYNTYKVEGYEADDIVNYLTKQYKDKFDYTIIYTNDKDIFVNICDNVGVMRFKTGHGYQQVDRKNYEEVLEKEFKVFIPYNTLGLFLASAGDSADNIKGITKFGPKAFGKLITKAASVNEIDFTTCGDYSKLKKVMEMCREFLTAEQYNELESSFELVANTKFDAGEALNEPKSAGSKDEARSKRIEAYSKYSMTSLV